MPDTQDPAVLRDQLQVYLGVLLLQILPVHESGEIEKFSLPGKLRQPTRLRDEDEIWDIFTLQTGFELELKVLVCVHQDDVNAALLFKRQHRSPEEFFLLVRKSSQDLHAGSGELLVRGCSGGQRGFAASV